MCENAIKLCILLGYKSFQLFHSTIKREFLKSFTKKICYKMKSFFFNHSVAFSPCTRANIFLFIFSSARCLHFN